MERFIEELKRLAYELQVAINENTLSKNKLDQELIQAHELKDKLMEELNVIKERELAIEAKEALYKSQEEIIAAKEDNNKLREQLTIQINNNKISHDARMEELVSKESNLAVRERKLKETLDAHEEEKKTWKQKLIADVHAQYNLK